MPDLTVELSVIWGSRNLNTTQTIEGVTGDAGYRLIREAVRKAADTAARCFPDPSSPYSDDLFKLGPDTRTGVQEVTQGRPDPEVDDIRRS